MNKKITQRLMVQFEDEAPRIGSGWRLLTVEIGWKWVRLINKSANKRARIKREVFDRLNKREIPTESDDGTRITQSPGGPSCVHG